MSAHLRKQNQWVAPSRCSTWDQGKPLDRILENVGSKRGSRILTCLCAQIINPYCRKCIEVLERFLCPLLLKSQFCLRPAEKGVLKLSKGQGVPRNALLRVFVVGW